eukprot:maker-scaffold_3-snap-gene-20.31-mRNA-1 protein AED:0.20 eAED:0.20 QI:58/1/0.66/1/0.5/0.66/3/0/1186
MEEQKENIAVIGSGITGLSAAYSIALSGKKVTLFEKKEKLGGHSYTVSQGTGVDKKQVDIGFQVFNLTTYPLLSEFFRHLEVETETSDMSFSYKEVRKDGSLGLEWASHGLSSVFAQRKNIVDKDFLLTLKDAVRFGKEAESVLVDPKLKNMTIGEFAEQKKYSKYFLDWYLLPMTAAVWSVPQKQMLDFPLFSFVRFWKNHHLLDPLEKKPIWRVCRNRTEDYVNKVQQRLISLGSEIVNLDVQKVEQNNEKYIIQGFERKFDQVIFACHSNQALEIVKNSDLQDLEEETKCLGKVKYSVNDVILHSDQSFLPQNKSAWASWNVLSDQDESKSVCVTYWLNNLQNLDKEKNSSKKFSEKLKLCTLNPIKEIDPNLISSKYQLEHPIFDGDAISAQEKLNKLQNGEKRKKVWFCGAWMANGFHEDGIKSSMNVVRKVLQLAETDPLPWQDQTFCKLVSPNPNYKLKDYFFFCLLHSACKRGIKKGVLTFVLPDGTQESFGRESKLVAQKLDEPISEVYINNLGICLQMIRDSDVGLGEAYISRDLNCSVEDLIGFIKILIINSASLTETMESFGLSSLLYKLGNLLLLMKHSLKKNTVAGSRRNIEAHYDLGNDMYKLFLDETMTYSSGIHQALDEPTSLENLKFAQEAKLDNLIKKLDIQEGDWVLEIGCGWGSFAKRAAQKKNCFVVGITISIEQLEYAREMLKKEGLEEKVCLILCDYRKLGMKSAIKFPLDYYGDSKFAKKVYKKLTHIQSFDKICSIEMIEAVGEDHLDEYFSVVNRMLRTDGKASLQAISVKDSSYDTYLQSSDFIRRHIFPGGNLVSLQRIEKAISKNENSLVLKKSETEDIGLHYATTLRMWRDLFMKNIAEIRAHGYPDAFIRKWVFYLVYCEAAFELEYIHDFQILLEKSPGSEVPKKLYAVSSEVLDQEKLPFESALLPAMLWTMGFMSGVPNLQEISFVAVLAVFVSSLLGAIFQDTLLRPPQQRGKKSQVVLIEEKAAWVDFLFSCLVLVSFFVTGFSILDKIVLFAVYGRLAAATARGLDKGAVYFMQALFFTGAMISTPSSPLLLGFHELHNVYLGARSLKFIEQDSFLGLSAIEFSGVLASITRGLPLSYSLVTFNFGFLAFPYILMEILVVVTSLKEIHDERENLYNTDELVENFGYKNEKEVLIQNMVEEGEKVQESR